MKKGLKRIRRTLKSVTVGDSVESFDASITRDLRGLIVHGVRGPEVEELVNSEATLFYSNVRQRHGSCAIVAGKMKKVVALFRSDIVGPVLCVFPNRPPRSLDALVMEKVHVSTPFVGFGGQPHFRLGDDTEEQERNVSLNQPVVLHPQSCDPIGHGDWISGPSWTLGDGFRFNGMVTTMPVDGTGFEAIETVRDRVELLLVLLTLLNGGFRVNVDKVKVRLAGVSTAVEMLFPTRKFDVLEFGMDYYFRNRLRCDGGLRSIGMEGVEKWISWYSRFRNRTILDSWLFSKDRLTSIPVVEGIGRAMLRDGGTKKRNIYFEESVLEIINTFDLGHVVSDIQVKALNEINKKLVKHIGDLSEEEDSKYRRDADLLLVLTSFLVGYALLRWALGDLPAAWDESWRGEIEGVAKSLSAPLA